MPRLSLDDLAAAPSAAPVTPLAPPSAGTPPQASAPDGRSIELPGTEQTQLLRGETRSAAGNIVRHPRDRSALDTVAGGVEWAETRGEHTDENGKVKVNPKSGATGLMQLLPSTARDLGVDPTDESQNAAGGRRYLGEMYDKYGNWDDALAAYNWGPGNVDKWIKNGHDPSKLPAETQQYVAQVLAHSGLDDAGPTSVVAEKRRLRADDLADLPDHPTGRISEGAGGVLSYLTDLPGKVAGDAYDTIVEPGEALLHGVRRGVQNLALGPAQMLGEQVAPEQTRAMTQQINNLEDSIESTKKHPVLATVGEVVGTTVGLVAGGGLLGSVKVGGAVMKVLPSIMERLGVVGRSAVAGGALGATSYNRDPDEASRVLEGVLGAGLGGIVGGLAKGVMTATQRLADSTALRDFVGTLRGVVGEVTPSTTKLKDNFLEQYERAWKTKNEQYTLRNAAGQEVQPGFSREEMSGAVADAMAGTRRAGVAPTPMTRSVASTVDREMGGPEARAAQAAHDAQVAQYEKDQAAWEKSARSVTRIENPAIREQATRRAIDSGALPPQPVHPGEFEPVPVSPEQYSAALQALNTARGRAKDQATKRQLSMMRDEIQSAASKTAEDVGMDVNEFMRAGDRANKFYRENILPTLKYFGWKNPGEIRGSPDIPFSGVTPAQFFDRATRVIESGDMEALRSFAKMVGEKAKPDLIKITAYNMLQKIDSAALRAAKGDTRAMAKPLQEYVTEHRQALQELVGRDGVEQLQGYANIAARMIGDPSQKQTTMLSKLLEHHGLLPAIGAWRVAEGIFTMHPKTIGIGGLMIAAPLLAHGLFLGLNKMAELPAVVPLIRRIGRTKPDSAEMTTLMNELSRRVVIGAASLGRTAAPGANAVAPAMPF
jgi:hypothetical protein